MMVWTKPFNSALRPQKCCCSSVGRAPLWYGGGHRFDPGQQHHSCRVEEHGVLAWLITTRPLVQIQSLLRGRRIAAIAPPCQGGYRGFESHRPLKIFLARVGQLEESLGREPKCWRFESSHEHQIRITAH